MPEDIDMISCRVRGLGCFSVFPRQPWSSPVSGAVGLLAQIHKTITKPCNVIKEQALKTASWALEFWDSRWFVGIGCLGKQPPIQSDSTQPLKSLKVMESLTAVGRRIPSLPLSPGFSPSPLHPLTACPRWDDAAGTDGHLAAEPLMKHTLFLSLSLYSSSPVSVPLSATPVLPPSHIWRGSTQTIANSLTWPCPCKAMSFY